jgi:hypothetical protein
MALKDFMDKIKGKPVIDQSSIVIPTGSMGEALNDLVKTILDPGNAKSLSIIDDERAFLGAILDAAVRCKDDTDLDMFYYLLSNNLFQLSSSIGGKKFFGIQDIAIGQMSIERQMELAQLKSGFKNDELKGVT